MDTIDVVNEWMLMELEDAGADIDECGRVALYHRTSEKNACSILRTGVMRAKEDGLFFSTKKNGQAVGYGDSIVQFRIPAFLLEMDDIFEDEAHVRLPLKGRAARERQMDVSGYLVGIQTPHMALDVGLGTLDTGTSEEPDRNERE